MKMKNWKLIDWVTHYGINRTQCPDFKNFLKKLCESGLIEFTVYKRSEGQKYTDGRRDEKPFGYDFNAHETFGQDACLYVSHQRVDSAENQYEVETTYWIVRKDAWWAYRLLLEGDMLSGADLLLSKIQ